MDMYKEFLLDHYKNPRNAGQLLDPDFSTGEYNPSCGDSITIHIKMEKEAIQNLAFVAKGCVISQAAASIVLEWCLGRNISEIMACDGQQVQQLIGMQLGPVRLKCALLALAALKKGFEAYGAKKE